MKGKITLKFLEYIRDFASDMMSLTEAFLSAGYGASSGRMRSEFDKIESEKTKRRLNKTKIIESRHRFYSMMNKLEKDGLIVKLGKQSGKNFKLTSKGTQKIKQLKKRRETVLPDPIYSRQNHGNFVIVVFDIPEADRRKRVWLRSALRNLNFRILQKSVWIGKIKIPKEFINDLKELKMVNHVEIFEISKGGTLRQIV